MTATPASSRKPSKSNTGNSAALTAAKQLSADIIAALGPSGVVSEYSSHGVRFAGDIRSNGVIECYGALRDTDNDSKPSAYVDTTTGKYKDSGGTETREIDLWEFIARKSGGDWLAVKRGLAERLGLAGGTVKGRRKSKAKPAPAAVESSAPATNGHAHTAHTALTRKPSESPATALGFEDWTPGKLRLLSYWCLKHRRGISSEAVLAAGGKVAKYPLGRTNPATGEAIDVSTDYVVCVPVYGEPVVEAVPAAPGLAGDGNDSGPADIAATTATAMLAAGPTAYVIWKLNGKPFAIYRGKDEKGEPIYDESKMKSIGSTDGVIGEHGLRVLADHDVAAAGPLTIVKPEGPTDLLALFTAQQTDAARLSNPTLAFAGTAKQANRWMAALFTGHTAVVVHDADRTGEAGVTKVCNLLSTTAADVRNVKLPYPIADKSGPDLRDYFNDGKKWGDFEEMVLWSESWVVEKEGTDGQAGDGADELELDTDADPNNPQASASEEPDFKPLEVADDPHRLARTYIQNHASIQDFGSTLRYWREEWHQWHGREYRLVPEYELSSKLNLATKEEFDRLNIIAQEIFAERTDEAKDDEEPPTARKVSRTLISDVNAAMKGMCLLSSEENAPFWIDGKGQHPADEIFATGSGLIHLPSLTDGKPNNLLPNTPNFFSPNAVSYRFPDDDPNKCEPPTEWITFLRTLWGDDHESISLLQEWMGYCLLPDTKQEKIMLIIGPPRSGKGTITRVLSQLVGERNVDSPKLGQFDKEYGLWSLLGKTVAIVEDARLSGRHNAAEIVESLLLISGRGRANVARKFLSTLNVALPVRFTIVSNELPALNDPSGAFASRCLLLQTHQSFLGKEDKTLSSRLEPELPGILIWAIQGWARLRERGYFELPSSSQEMIDDLYTLTSPAKAFIEECCNVGPGLECAPQVAYDAYREWCKEQGKKPEVSQLFGRNLKAALPHLNTEQRWNGGRKGRVYIGMTVKPALT